MSEVDSKKEMMEKLLQKQQEAKTIRKIVLTTFIVLVVLFTGIIGGGYIYIKSALQPVDPDQTDPIEVTIPIGSSVSSIASILEDHNIIKDEKVFKYYVKFKNESGFQAGDYMLNKAMTFDEIIASLKSGKVVQEPVFKMTIPEGKQLVEIAAIIAEQTPYSEEEILTRVSSKEFIEKMKGIYPDTITDDVLNDEIKYPLEGYLYPATYSFYEEEPELDAVLETMIKKTDEVVQEYQEELVNQNMSTHEFLTMASLIEEEATEKVDREKIASVFYNRIERGMKLQTDPTVLYAHGEHKERVLYKDLEIDSPYNTYKVTGLPPGPIANAGKMSLDAALKPADTDFLYFLAKPDGEVVFNNTLKEHNEDKAKYITSQ
ncbi:endolytic transglycosylase MltG [Bacillus kexueae]|uniref:endolytic transglycosylase MltG n=1 Tax=Aeribacillus kexueae TaxID=2078952 RepID=UPI001FAFE6F1|nr:endolytic transglycosylase MltG [Bacillus kexueae]